MGDAPDSTTAELTTAELAALVSRVGSMPPAVDDVERIDRLRLLASLTSAISAAEMTEGVAFAASQQRAQTASGTPVERSGRGVAEQIALARRISPWQARRWLGLASILTSELPATFATLAAGETTAWRATLVARETAVLSKPHQAAVDAELAPHLPGWGDKQVDAEVRKAAYRLDPAAAVARARKAERERRVGIRPAPDTMCWLSALLPVKQGVAAYAALRAAANSCTAAGDDRGLGQIMADTLVERVTGQTTADAVGVEIVLVMNDDTLLPADDPFRMGGESRTDVEPHTRTDAGFRADASSESEPATAGSGPAAEPTRRSHRRTSSDEPAWLEGYGPVPAGWARELAYGRGDHAPAGPRWLRRLYTHRGRPVELESTRRLLGEGQQRFLRLRDRICRTPWCDAPIRHADHVDSHDFGGPTHTDNGQGLCAACNHAKQASGWVSIVHPDGTITTQTPTGHRYDSPPPDITGPPPSNPPSSQPSKLPDTAD